MSALVLPQRPPPELYLDQNASTAVSITPVQEEIVRTGDVHWISVEIRLPSGSVALSLESIQQAWSTVALRSDILRASVRFTNFPGFLVLGKVAEVVENDHPPSRCIEYDTAHLVVSKSANQVFLHLPQFLVDERSIRLIEHDIALVYSGAQVLSRDPFFNYVSEVNARDIEAALQHWKLLLSAVPQRRAPIPILSTSSTSRQDLRIDVGVETLLRLRTFADEYTSGDLFTVLQSAWAIVLAAHGGTEDALFAAVQRDTCSSARNANAIVGRMDITFPIVAQLAAGAPLVALLQEVKSGQADGKHFGWVGMTRILEQWDVAKASIFSALRMCGRGVQPRAQTMLDDGSFPLVLRFGVLNSFRIDASYDASLSHDHVHILLEHFVGAVTSILETDPFIGKIADVRFVSAEEHAMLLEQARPRTPMRRELLHRLVEARAAEAPNALAVEEFDGWRAWTIGEINRAANILARQLNLGGRREGIIPVCVERTVHLVIALLAVLKTGNAYVILDPEQPKERLELIIEDIKPPFVLGFSKFAILLSVPVKDIAQLIAAPGTLDSNLHVPQNATSLAYLVYTSGSSGRPKGVELTHGAVTSGILAAQSCTGIRSLLFFNPIFSAAQRTIWSTILNGGVLCLAPKESLMRDLAGIVTRMRVTTLGMTTTAAGLFSPSEAPTLRTITLTGERVTDAVVDRWADAVDLRSGFGLSECTQINWAKSLAKGKTANRIGAGPSDSTSAYILLPNTTYIAPLLVPGELCLAGPQLARGYLNLPQLTDTAFVPNPFGPGKLYRTGDKAVYHQDGSIELLGRLDRQVKVSGQRVDPEEVESVIRAHPSINNAAVEALVLSGATVLIACVELTDPDAAVIEHCVERLPGFAVPSYFLHFVSLPTTATGKIDHAALRAELSLLNREDLLSRSITRSTTSTLAQSAEEKALASSCSTVLDIPLALVSMDASLVRLGGSSLQAIQLSSLLRKQGWSVAVSDIILSPNLADLALKLAPLQDVDIPEPFSLVHLDDGINWQRFEDVYPVSSLQEGIIASTLSGNKDYLYQRVYDISERDLVGVQSALSHVFQQQTILRTTFFSSGSTILQGVLPASTPLPWVELPASLSLEEYKRQDLEEGVKFESLFWRAAHLPAHGLLVISSHHALFDFWSNSFLIDDAALVYEGGSPAFRPPYNTFIKYTQSLNSAASKTFWTEYLAGAQPSTINIPDSNSGSVVSRTLSPVDPEYLKANAITHGSLIYAAWGLVLRIHNICPGSVVFATTLAARDLPIAHIDHLAGPTLASVPQRIHFPDPDTLSTFDYLNAVQRGLWNMIPHAQYGMHDALQVTDAKTGLFNTMVNIVTKEKRQANPVFKPYGSDPVWRTEYVTLEVAVGDFSKDPIHVKLVSQLDVQRATFVLEQFANAFSALSSGTSSKISALQLLGEEEIAFLQSRATYDPPTEKLVHSGMEAIALASPQQTALEWEDGTVVSYGELNAKAEILAAMLVERGVGPDVIVPLCVDKSIEMIIGIYGILKAGGAYVPLDPENPIERNRFIISDVEAVVGVTFPKYAHIFPDDLPLLLFDTAGQRLVKVGGDDMHPLVLVESKPAAEGRILQPLNHGPTSKITRQVPTPANLAYCIYTSGSTGNPKGVLVNHSGISTSLTGRILAEGYKPSWRTLLFANYVFDVSASDIFTVLSVGGVLCLASMDNLMTNLAECIASFNANQISITPTVARLLQTIPPCLTHMALAGEACTGELVAMFSPHLKLSNAYGPTEASVYSTWADMTEGKNAHIIGHPLCGVGSIILHPGTTDMVPYGAIGEYSVVGPHVGRGYLKRPETNAKSFINWKTGERMYRTGDLMRWEPSGELSYFGRHDNQVKIAGHRMELGEIEHAITTTGIAFGRCVVVLQVAGKPQLAAFVLLGEEVEADNTIIQPPSTYAEAISEIRGQLSASLPPYMVPKFFIPITRLPITLGARKVDRALLTRLAHELSDINAYGSETVFGPYVACTTPAEIQLRELWADILQVDVHLIGATSSFFQFGGDSITAIGLVGKCRSRGVGALGVGDVLANPLLRDMATKLKVLAAPTLGSGRLAYKATATVYALAGVVEADVEIVLPAGPGQIEFLELGNRPDKFWLLQTTREVPADFDIGRWVEITAELTRRNPILRTTFVKDENGKWLQVVLRSNAPRIREVLVESEEAMAVVVQEEWDTEFARGEPWVRYVVIIIPDGRRFLLHRVSHAVYDGTSLRVLDAQFVAIARGEPVPEIPSFNPFIEYTESVDRDDRRDFWRKILHGSTFNYPSAPTAVACNAVHLVHFDNDVDACASKHAVTTPVVFQTAFSLLLARLSGASDISFDSLVTGRDVPVENAQEMSGACATFLPFRIEFDQKASLNDLLKRTQTIFWDTNERGDIPIMDILPTANRCLFLFQPFQPSQSGAAVDHMRWCVMGMSKVRQEMNYALMMEVFKTAAGGYVVRLRHDRRIYERQEIEAIGEELQGIVAKMGGSDERTAIEQLM